MNALLLSTVAVAAAYLVGGIPFGYLVARYLRGIDIRTVGSGNIGATNVGRVLGFRFFLLVFAFDLLKGLLPTLYFPRLVDAGASPDLPVLVALATILGHNFPVYLKFKGGKGVATSLGAVLALDPLAGAGAAVGFLMCLVVTRFVSISSMFGGLTFALVHFSRVAKPWSREERAMTLLTFALVVLLVARHRKNIGRIAAGTEPRVPLRKSRSGRISAVGVLALVVATLCVMAGGVWLGSRVRRQEAVAIGETTVREVAQVVTGHQRAERVAFADGGRLLVVSCPRYNRVVFYRVTDDQRLEEVCDLDLDGMPKAVCPSSDRVYVLVRPAGDQRHVERGWYAAFDFEGRRVGEPRPVGYYPDDMVLLADQRLAVVCSGSSEGDETKPPPSLDLYDAATGTSLATMPFDRNDDPARLTASRNGTCLSVTLLGSKCSAAVEINEGTSLRLLGRTPLAEAERPYLSRGEGDQLLMPVASGREALAIDAPGLGACIVACDPGDSAIELYRPETGFGGTLGALRLRGGVFKLSKTRPTGLAYCAEKGLVAVANRSGSVHLVAIRAGVPAVSANVTAPRAN